MNSTTLSVPNKLFCNMQKLKGELSWSKFISLLLKCRNRNIYLRRLSEINRKTSAYDGDKREFMKVSKKVIHKIDKLPEPGVSRPVKLTVLMDSYNVTEMKEYLRILRL